jgi:hypothetical protein
VASSKLDGHIGTVKLWLASYKTNEEIVRLFAEAYEIKTTEASVRRLIERFDDLQELSEIRHTHNRIKQEAEAPGYSTDGTEYEVTEPLRTLGENENFENVARLTIEKVMERHQLDPEVWDCERVMPNVWQGQQSHKLGGGILNFYQFKLFFKKKVPIVALLPATEPLKRSYKAVGLDKAQPVITMIETDPQHPFVIEGLNELALQFINDVRPARHIVGGDLMNLGYIGRHRDNPKWDDTIETAKQSAFEWLYHRRNANEDMEMHLIPGNHDDRIRNEQLERNERMYGVTQAHYPGDEPGPRVYSLSHLLRLPELDINYSEPEGTYEFEYVEVTPLLAVRHGHKLNQSKTAPINTAMELGHSVVLGHSHHQSAVARTIWNKLSGQWYVRWAIEAGCECEIEEGLGFNKAGAPDWQPGFVTVTSWPSGEFTFDFAQYTQEGALYWRDKRYTL